MFNRLGLLHKAVGVQPARIQTSLLRSAKQFHTTKYLQNGNVFGELTKGKESDEAEIEKQNNIDVSQVTPATDSTLQEYYLEEAKKSQLTSDKYITPLKQKLFQLNVQQNGFFKNNEIFTDPETEKVYKLALTEEEIDILEPSIYLQSYRIKSSMKKATQVNRFVRGYKVKNAINQLHFNPKKMSTELEKLLKKGLEQARESNYNEDELYIQALWVGSDGNWRKRLDAKGRGRTGIIEHPHIHLKAILRTDQTANRLKWENHQKQLNQKPRMFLNNEPLNFRVHPFYRW